jgi:osmoprotectant transport system substrate-binding protein
MLGAWTQRYFGTLRSRMLLFAGLGVLLYSLGKLGCAQPLTEADVIIGSKNFTESRILGEMYAQVLESHGFRVRRRFNLGGTLITHAALQNGEIDLYPEYTGTGLLDILGLPMNPQNKVNFSEDANDAIDRLNRHYEKRWALHWLSPALANDSQGLVISRQLAATKHIYTISRLAEVSSQLRLAVIPEFEDRADGLPGLQKAYPGLHFKQIQQFDNGLKYSVLLNREADVTVGFTTDSDLLKPQLLLLKDDRHFWPEYRIAPVVRLETLHRYPRVAEQLNQLSQTLDTQTMRRLNAAVDIQQQEAATVAHSFLKQRRLIP